MRGAGHETTRRATIWNPRAMLYNLSFMAVTEDEFKNALGRFASGVTVVTLLDNDGRRHGITVSAFSSVSLDPPMILVCIEKTAGSHAAFVETDRFVVNILAADQSSVSDRFAFRHDDKFAGIDFETGPDGIPVLPGCLANLSCRTRNRHDGGDHTIFVAEVESATTSEMPPLIYWKGKYI
jgi:3-hydroxy-9,10-secoandrosta-1,3,5(10)-triene-9,17-dione monooxygenase reductase component